MSDAPGSGPVPPARKWLLPATVAIVLEIVVNAVIIWYLLVRIPGECALLAEQIAGRSTCGIEPGTYGIAGISALLIVAGVALLAWWHAKKGEVLKKPGR